MKTVGRKFFILIIILVALAGVIWGGWHHTQPSYFPVKHVKIFANYEHVDKTTLQTIIADYTKQGFFYLQVGDLKKQLLQVPWIYALAIRRVWPDTLIINIAEQHAITQWGEKSLINASGVIFTPPVATFPQELPALYGPEERVKEIFTIYQEMLTILEPLDLTIKKLVLNPEHFWTMLLNNNTVVSLKEKDPAAQLNLLVSVYRKITANHNHQDPKYIDLRYKRGFAVKWN